MRPRTRAPAAWAARPIVARTVAAASRRPPAASRSSASRDPLRKASSDGRARSCIGPALCQ
eukprot:15465011-Alexandrium_andersonii.AAC.1